MTLGTVLLLLYWVLFTARRGWEPKVNQRIRAREFDLKQCTPDEAEEISHSLHQLRAARGALRVASWAEIALLVVITAYFFWLIGALIFGTTVIFGAQI